jgi:glycosidase
MSVTGGDLNSIKLMTILQMTLPGAPCVYYGDEIGLAGERDPDCRRAMPWDESTWNLELLEFTTHAIALRNGISALRQGTFKTLYANDMTVVFERKLENSYALVVLNADTQALQIKLEGMQNGVFDQRFSNQTLSVAGGILRLEIAARTGEVLVLRP